MESIPGKGVWVLLHSTLAKQWNASYNFESTQISGMDTVKGAKCCWWRQSCEPTGCRTLLQKWGSDADLQKRQNYRWLRTNNTYDWFLMDLANAGNGWLSGDNRNSKHGFEHNKSVPIIALTANPHQFGKNARTPAWTILSPNLSNRIICSIPFQNIWGTLK